MQGLYSLTTSFWGTFVGVQDDDWADRMHRVGSCIMLVIFAIFTASYASLGTPITCWLTAGLEGKQGYVNEICWISNTYWVPFTEPIPGSPGMSIQLAERETDEISYYQWVPIVLLLQAGLFAAPRVLWQAMSWYSGINLKDVMQSVANEYDVSTRGKKLAAAAGYIDAGIDMQREAPGVNPSSMRRSLSTLCWPCFGKPYGKWLFPFYMAVKIGYLIIAILQVLILQFFLRTPNGRFLGLEIIASLTNYKHAHHSWRETGVFPRVTMCDFLVRVMANIHRHTVQCALPVNMYNEKIFLFIWFWIFISIVMTVFNIASWLLSMCVATKRKNFIKRNLISIGLYHEREGSESSKQDRKILDKFLSVYLQPDGVFVLRMIKQNAGQFEFAEVLTILWRKYKTRFEVGVKMLEKGRSKSTNGLSRNNTVKDNDTTKLL